MMINPKIKTYFLSITAYSKIGCMKFENKSVRPSVRPSVPPPGQGLQARASRLGPPCILQDIVPLGPADYKATW